jgi:glycosyltransferase involved in cell wall biosynthesis
MTIQASDYTAVLVTYNAEDSVLEALSAMVLQKPPPSEIIVIDDCSNDRTVEIIQEFNSDKIILQLIVNDSNKGQSLSRNIAAGNATYPIIIFFDDDDISLPNRANFHLKMISDGADISYVSSKKTYGLSYEVENINDSIENELIDTSAACRYIFSGIRIDKKYVFSVPACTLGMRTEVFNDIGGFDVEMRRLEDVDLFLRATEYDYLFSWSSSIGVIRRHSIGNDKGGILDSEYEIALLERYRVYLSEKIHRDAKFTADLRRIYFSGAFRDLPLFLARNPRGIFVLLSRIRSLARRLIHDWRKEAK